jgi:hypothetical protein
MRKYTGKDAEVFALMCQKSNELEKDGIKGTELLKQLVAYYTVAADLIRNPKKEKELIYPF